MGFLSRLLGTSRGAAGVALKRPYQLVHGGFSAVAGESHYQETLKRTARIARMERDEEGEDRLCFEATLVREPDNPYDAKAVAVHSRLGIVGYAPRGSEWSELLDRLAQRGHDGAACRANLTGGDAGKSWGVVLHARPDLELEELAQSSTTS